MMEVGRLCLKIAGRDAGMKCVIVEVIDDNFMMIDGETRRRKCNVKHLEPLKETISIKKGADHSVIVAEFKKLGMELKETKPKPKTEKPKRMRSEQRKKMAPKVEKKKAPVKKEVKAEPAPEETKLEKELGVEEKKE